MSIPASTALTNSQSALTGIQTVADNAFIAAVDSQIQTAITLGQTQVTALTAANVNITNVFNYYTNLGYNCTFPDYLQQNGNAYPTLVYQPSNYFGYNWTQFWLNSIGAFNILSPARMTVSWTPYTVPVNDEFGEV